MARAESLGRELEDIVSEFKKTAEKELATINPALEKGKLEGISVLAETDWQKKREAEGASGSGAGMQEEAGNRWEKD